MRLNFLIIFFLSVLNVDIDLFLFEMSLKWCVSKLFSFDSFLIIDLEDRVMITNNVFDRNDKSLDVNILLSSCLYYLNTNNTLSFNISNIILYLFIYDFSRIKSCYFNGAIRIGQDFFLWSCIFKIDRRQWVIDYLNNRSL